MHLAKMSGVVCKIVFSSPDELTMVKKKRKLFLILLKCGNPPPSQKKWEGLKPPSQVPQFHHLSIFRLIVTAKVVFGAIFSTCVAYAKTIIILIIIINYE